MSKDTQQDPMKMDIEDLGAMLQNPPDLQAEETPDEEPVEEQEQAQEEEGEPEESAQEDEEGEEESEEEGEEAEEAEPEPETETESEPEPSTEELRSLLAEAEARAKHFESVAGRNAGRADFERRRAEQLQASFEQLQSQRPQQGEDDYGQVQPPPPPAQQQPPPQPSAPAEAIHGAMQYAWTQFAHEHPDMVEDKGGQSLPKQELAQALQSMQNVDVSHILESSDLNFVHSQTKLLLEGLYQQIAAKREVERREEAKRKKMDQAAGLKRKKRASAVASSGGRRASSKKAPVDPMTMDLDELAKLIDKTKPEPI